jgi:hypothetical protein
MFQNKVVKKIKTRILCSVPPPPPENRVVYETMWEKFCTAGQPTDNNIADAHCMLDT